MPECAIPSPEVWECLSLAERRLTARPFHAIHCHVLMDKYGGLFIPCLVGSAFEDRMSSNRFFQGVHDFIDKPRQAKLY